MNFRQAATASAFFARLGFGTLTFLVPYSLGVEDAAMVGLIIALRPAVEMLVSVPTGVLSDYTGRRLPLVCGLVATGLILCIFGELRNPIQLAIASAAMGFSSALVVPSALALMLDCSSPKERGVAIGVIVAALGAGSFVGFVIAGFLVSQLSQRITYIIPGIFAVVTGGVIFVSTSSLRSSRKLDAPSRMTMLMRKQAWLLLSILIILILVSTASIFLPLYAGQTKLSPNLASASYIALALIALSGYVVGGTLSDKWGRHNLMYVGLVFVLLAEVALVWGYRSENWEVVFVFLALASVGVGTYAPSALALLGDLFPRNAYGAAMGSYDFLLSLSEIIGPIVTGALVGSFGFSSLAVFGVLLTLLAIIVIRLRPTVRSSSNENKSGDNSRATKK